MIITENIKLTRDGDALICIFYKAYCERRKNGQSIESSCYMGDDDLIHSSLTPKWCLDDVTHLCWYLEDKDLVHVFPGDNKANDVSLSDDGVYYMENRFPNGLPQIIEALTKLSALVVPWL